MRYEYLDPALQSATAGHKLMVRLGADHQRRLKAKLRELRAELQRRAVCPDDRPQRSGHCAG